MVEGFDLFLALLVLGGVLLGIVNVSAKDLGTGNEQKVTITSSTNLTEDEINQRVKEAEQYAAEDKKRKEEVETLPCRQHDLRGG